ncbi:MAG: cation:proton antiporter [Alkaliphilus sp.]
MNLLIKIAIVLLTGIVGGKVAKRLQLPNVTGYLAGGLLIGPSFIHVISDIDIASFTIINEVALAAIAFSIGSEFHLRTLAKVGKKIVVLTLYQAIATMVLVFAVCFFIFDQSFQFSILICTIAAATAPAATTMVIKQYKAKGPLTQTILPIVAIDDAVCVIAFGIAMAISRIMMGGTDLSLFQMMTHPVVEIVGSLGVGIIVGVFLTLFIRNTRINDEILIIVLAVVLISAGIAKMFHLSPILLSMMVGATITNILPRYKKAFRSLSTFTPPVYLFFFTLAGASLHIDALASLGLLGAGYVIARAVGKIAGSAVGAKATGFPKIIVKYLGLTLLPQAGVAIGLAMTVRKQLPEIGETLIPVVLGGVFVYEVFGPVLAKIALDRAGEIDIKSTVK